MRTRELVLYAFAGIGLCFVGLLLFAGGPVDAADDGRVDEYFDGFRVGSDGTKIDLLHAGELTISKGDTSTTASVTSAADGDAIVASFTSNPSAASVIYCAISGAVLTITVDTDPDVDVTVGYIVVGTP